VHDYIETKELVRSFKKNFLYRGVLQGLDFRCSSRK